MVKRIVFLAILLYSTLAFAQYEHVFFTGDHFRVKWDVGSLALGYEWHVERIDNQVIVREDQTVLFEVSFFITSAGTYVFYCRAWNFAEDGETIQYSKWATSLTHGLVDGIVTPWQIKIKLKPVGPLIFDGYPIE